MQRPLPSPCRTVRSQTAPPTYPVPWVAEKKLEHVLQNNITFPNSSALIDSELTFENTVIANDGHKCLTLLHHWQLFICLISLFLQNLTLYNRFLKWKEIFINWWSKIGQPASLKYGRTLSDNTVWRESLDVFEIAY